MSGGLSYFHCVGLYLFKCPPRLNHFIYLVFKLKYLWLEPYDCPESTTRLSMHFSVKFQYHFCIYTSRVTTFGTTTCTSGTSTHIPFTTHDSTLRNVVFLTLLLSVSLSFCSRFVTQSSYGSFPDTIPYLTQGALPIQLRDWGVHWFKRPSRGVLP